MEKESLRDVTMNLVEEYRERMGELAYRRVRHVVTEIERYKVLKRRYDKLTSI